MNEKGFFIFWACFCLPIAAWAQSIQLGDSLLKQGKQYDGSGNMQQAAFYYGEAYQIYRNFKDTTSWLEAGKEYASALVYRSKNDQAMELYKMLLRVDHPGNDVYNRGDIYNSMGWASNQIGKVDQAVEYYQKSLPLALESSDSLLIGIVYDNLGATQSEQGNYLKSLELRQKALPYFQSLNNQQSIAKTLNNIGSIYAELSLLDKAVEYYNQSLAIREEIGDVRMLSTIYDNIAGVQRDLGNYDQALIAFQKSLSYSKRAGTPRSTARILNNIGLLYKTLGEYDKARDYYRQSLAIKEETSGPRSLATTTNNLGKLLWEQGETEEAADHYQKSLALRKQVGNPYDIASSLNMMVDLELQEGDHKQARSYTHQIQAIGDSTENYNILKNASNHLGKINAAENNDRVALQHYKKAYAYSEYLPASNRLDILQQVAREYHKLNSDSAVVYGQKAVDIIEQNRLNAGATSDLKTGYFKKHSDFYKELASWVLQYEQDTARAFQLAEQAKARSFSDDLAKASQNIDQTLPEEVRVNREEQRNNIDSLYTQLETAEKAKKQAQISDDIRTAELNYAAYENKLMDEYPELEKMERPEPISLPRAQNLTDDQTAVLEYAVADNELIMFFISRDEVRVDQFSLPDDRPLDSVLTARVTDFRDAILANAKRTELRDASDQLYNALLNPFEESLDDYSNLVIVPDGALTYLPFEALLRNDRYLIEDFRIKYEPSLTSLTLLDTPEPVDQKELLAVAGSQFSEDRERVLSNNQLSALPSTVIEVDSIASHFRQVSMLKEDEVSEQAFKNLLQQNRYRYVHMATHGIIDEDRPRRSGLALSAKGEITASSKEDGMLRSSEIFGLDITSDMVVLSACNTGLGKVVKGEGILGLQRSFFYAGTSTVVVSLWNVYDRSTASLMTEFYKALINGEEESWIDSMLRWVGWDQSIPFGQKATAMRQAKLQMIDHPLFNHPIYWAPFIVVGR